jgi:hypothetical protein
MKFIKSTVQKLRSFNIQSFIKDDKKILGRWNIEDCNKKMNHKIDLSNEDHCGPCGQYLLTKTKNNNKN